MGGRDLGGTREFGDEVTNRHTRVPRAFAFPL